MVVCTPGLGRLGTQTRGLLRMFVSCWVTQKDSSSTSKEAKGRGGEEREEKERKWEEKMGPRKAPNIP